MGLDPDWNIVSEKGRWWSILNFTGFGTACPTPVTLLIFTEKAARQNWNRKWVEHERYRKQHLVNFLKKKIEHHLDTTWKCRSPFSFASPSSVQHHPPAVAERNLKTTQVDSTKKSGQLSANHLWSYVCLRYSQDTCYPLEWRKTWTVNARDKDILQLRIIKIHRFT